MVTASFRKCLVSKAFSWDTYETFCFTNLSYMIYQVSTYTIYILITHRNYKEAIQREKPQIGFLQHTHPFYLLLLPSLIVISWEEICTQTQPTHFQSVESVLKLGKFWGFAKISWWGLEDAIGRIAGSGELEKTRFR